MRCRRVLDQLPLFAGGDLSPRIREAVSRHLEGCPRCNVEFEAYRGALEALESYRTEGRPLVSFPDFWAALATRIREDERSGLRPVRILEPAPPPRGRSWKDFPLFAAAGFLVALLGFLPLRGFWLGGSSGGAVDPVPQRPSLALDAGRPSAAGGVAENLPRANPILARGIEDGFGAPAAVHDPQHPRRDEAKRDEATTVHYHLPELRLVSTSGSVE